MSLPFRALSPVTVHEKSRHKVGEVWQRIPEATPETSVREVMHVEMSILNRHVTESQVRWHFDGQLYTVPIRRETEVKTTTRRRPLPTREAEIIKAASAKCWPVEQLSCQTLLVAVGWA